MLISKADPRAETYVASFRQRLQELGWVDGRNVLIDIRCGWRGGKFSPTRGGFGGVRGGCAHRDRVERGQLDHAMEQIRGEELACTAECAIHQCMWCGHCLRVVSGIQRLPKPSPQGRCAGRSTSPYPISGSIL